MTVCKIISYTSFRRTVAMQQSNGKPIMYASIFTARGKRFELVIHSTPAISGESVQAQYYYATRAEAKAAAKAIGAKPWNY